MLLLSFTVRNHGSVRDEVTLDLTRPSLRTLQPSSGSWGEATYPLAGIFGANATGKSALLDALIYMFTAIRFSATTWQSAKSMQRVPYLLDGTAATSSSSYEIDFIHDNRRHRYGFEVDADGIKHEWLLDVPSLRWRTLLDRDRDDRTVKTHASLRARIEVTRRELALSRALLLPESPFHGIARTLANGFDFVLVKDSHREARLSSIADSLAEGAITFSDLVVLLQVADIGITRVDIEEQNIPEHVLRAFRRYQHDVAHGPSADADSGAIEVDLDDEQLALVVRNLVFTHRGSTDACPEFSIREESDGTIAWLAIAVPALEILRRGGLLVVDEIDASLHPHLLEVLLGAFANPEVNTTGAQLIFTSHESYILSPLSSVSLEPEQVWFTDKTYEGTTELTSLADFPRHPDANVAKRYLAGRYGGTPRLSPTLLAVLIDQGEGH